MSRLLRLLGVLALAVACLPAGSAAAASFTVATTADSGPGSLRSAIQASNDPAVADTITITATGTIELASALPVISDEVTIAGPGAASLTIARGASAPPFRILYFSGAGATVSGLTVSGGIEASGAGIQNSSADLTLIRVVVTGNEAFSEGPGTRYATGGGILNVGTMTLRESSVIGNAATAKGGDENIAAGAGIESEGTLLVERSTISGNVARALGGGGAKAEAIGGGIAIANMSSSTIVEESTISGNSVFAADATDEATARGGGIWGAGTVSLTGSTIAANGAELEAVGVVAPYVAGVNVDSGVIARNSIIALPAGEGESCANGLVSGGFNLDEDGSCDFSKSSDLASVIAGLDPALGDNGGPTPTLALLPGSPAIDRGNSFASGIDQRGFTRPSDFPAVSNAEGGDGADIGAFELQLPPASPGGGTSGVVTLHPTDSTPPNTRIVSGPPRTTYKTKAKFRFASSEGQSHFQCKLDKKKWKPCANPFKATVKPGKHLFKVRAIDRFGNADPTPARFGWRVKRIVG